MHIVILLTAFSYAQEWVARYDGPSNGSDCASAIAVDAAGNVYVTGHSVVSGTASDYVTVKYDSLGIEQWVARYNGTGNDEDRARSIAINNTGDIYITGWSVGIGTGYDYATVKYNSSGVEQWVVRYNGPMNDHDFAHALDLDNTGGIHITGCSMGDGTASDYVTIKYNSSGTEMWVAQYNGTANAYENAYAIAVDAAHDVYVTGRSPGLGTEDDYATVKYDSFGVEQWVARYNGPSNEWDEARAIATDTAGNVYVTGYSMGSGTGYDYATVKYNSPGVEQWVARYNGPGNGFDGARAITVDNIGYIYVTGASAGSDSEMDFATIKYAADYGIQENRQSTHLQKPRFLITPTIFSQKAWIIVHDISNSDHGLFIYNTIGEVVKEFNSATTQIIWNGCDDSGDKLPNGVYFVTLKLGTYTETKKVLLIN